METRIYEDKHGQFGFVIRLTLAETLRLAAGDKTMLAWLREVAVSAADGRERKW